MLTQKKSTNKYGGFFFDEIKGLNLPGIKYAEYLKEKEIRDKIRKAKLDA